jgi:hypothetical protein
MPTRPRSITEWWPFALAAVVLGIAVSLLSATDETPRRIEVVVGLGLGISALAFGYKLLGRRKRASIALLVAGALIVSSSIVVTFWPKSPDKPALEIHLIDAGDDPPVYVVPNDLPLVEIPGLGGGLCTGDSMNWLVQHGAKVRRSPIVEVRSLAEAGPRIHLTNLQFKVNRTKDAPSGYTFVCPNAGEDQTIEVQIDLDNGTTKMRGKTDDRWEPFGISLEAGEVVHLVVTVLSRDSVQGTGSITATLESESRTITVPLAEDGQLSVPGVPASQLYVQPGGAGTFFCLRGNSDWRQCTVTEIP